MSFSRCAWPGVKQQIESEVVERTLDGATASEVFRAIVKRVRRMVAEQYACWRNDLLPSLAKNGIRILEVNELDAGDLEYVLQYYRSQVRPVLTPLAIDPAHPFPQLLNKSLNLIVRLEMAREGQALKHLAVVQIPRILPRLVKLPRSDGRLDYIHLGRADRPLSCRPVPRHKHPGLLALPRHPEQRALHRRGGDRQPAQRGRKRAAQPPQRRRRPAGGGAGLPANDPGSPAQNTRA